MKIVIPASTSNLGPGFDTIGVALNRYVTIEAVPARSFSIDITGEGAGEIPTDDRNLVGVAMRKVLKTLPPLRLAIHNDIPSCGGFGASGAAIVGGLLLANELSGNKMTTDDLYNAGIGIEGHPDNVSAALFGGMVINARDGDGRYSHIKLDLDGDLKFVAIIPDTKIETEAARRILPRRVTLEEAVANVQHSSLLVAAVASGRHEMLKYAVRDELHEKHRKSLIPHYDEFREAAARSGALAFTISGAGSGCIAFSLGRHREILEAFSGLIERKKLRWRTELFEPVNEGAVVAGDLREEPAGAASSGMD